MAKNKHWILNCGKKKTLLGGPKEGKARRAGQRATMAFRRVVITLTSHTSYKGAGKDFNQNKGKGNDQKGKSDEGLHSQSRRSVSEAPDEEGYGMPGNRMTGLPASGLTILVF